MSEVVTGDAVVLDVQIAQLPVRAVGALIDITVIFIGYVLGLMLWAATLTQFDAALSAAVLIIFTVLVMVGYPLMFETATRGRSVGKIVMGLRVVSDDGGPERFRQALFRALASVVEIWMLFGQPRSDLQHLVAEGQTHRRHLRRHRRGQRTRTPVEPAAGDAAGVGVVGVVAATFGPDRRPGRGCAPISFPRITTRSPTAPSDGIPDRR